jgi:oligopeptide/dipeptide ABC transporter ATP-binding protein
MPLLEIRDLKTYFSLKEGLLKAVDGVSFQMREGETLGLVGESGCGKSVLALSILRLIQDPPGKIFSGEILFDGTNLLDLSPRQMRAVRGKEISMIFQDPMTSLNPVLTIGYQISESFRLHQALTRHQAWNNSIEMLGFVGIPSPNKRVFEYPHQLSGGMRQRALAAMALSCKPKLIIADEPTTALDVTIQAQVLDLINNIKENYKTSILLITHDLGIVAEMAERIIVMYAGKIVENATTKDLFKYPLHPYTQGLLRSIPRIDVDRGNVPSSKFLPEIPGNVPNPIHLPDGCTFAPRCAQAVSICRKEMPDLKDTGSTHSVRCWLYHQNS